MATFKILRNASSFSAVRYNEQKQHNQKAERTKLINFAWLENKENLTQADIKAYLVKWSSFNSRVKYKQFHAVISAKGKSESFEQLEKKALHIMKRLGYGNNPILLYAHKDTNNNHIHIVSSRINENGQKINDSFEHVRAMKALQEIENIEPQIEFDKDIKDALDYNVTTVHQFNLLMEQKGYDAKLNGGEIDYWKYNAIQGHISAHTIQAKINNIDKVKHKQRTKQIKAIILKYQSQFDTRLKNTKPQFSTGKDRFQSPLTEHLRRKFGLDFVFFSKPNADKPYGYMVIDNKTKTVFKGSEILKLDHLINIDTNRSLQTTDNIRPKESNISGRTTHNEKLTPKSETDFIGSASKDVNHETTASKENTVDNIIAQTNTGHDQGGKLKTSTDDLPVKRRRKKIRNRR